MLSGLLVRIILNLKTFLFCHHYFIITNRKVYKEWVPIIEYKWVWLMLLKSINILKSMQSSNGLFSAASCAKTGYHRAWIRDNVYTALGLEASGNKKEVIKAYRALLDILLKHEWKIDLAIKQKPNYHFEYIHPRYELNGNEIYENWGNKQNDAIGAFLFKIGDLEEKGIKIIRNKKDLRILQKLVNYLKSVEYWHDKDNGMWEENEEVHASSVGACIAGLKKIRKIIGIEVENKLIEKGIETLDMLLPNESESKSVDLALLSLIYPYNIVNEKQKNQILKNIEIKLVRNKGLIRYLGDRYYSNGKEAEWTFGFPWLAIIYKDLKMPHKYAFYMRKTTECFNEKGELPELYFGETDEHNENCPLAWSQAMYVTALTG